MFGEDGLGQFEHFPSQLEVGRILFLLLFLGLFVSVVFGIAGASLVGANGLVVFDGFGTIIFGAWTGLGFIAFFFVLRLLFTVFIIFVLFAVFFRLFCKINVEN